MYFWMNFRFTLEVGRQRHLKELRGLQPLRAQRATQQWKNPGEEETGKA